MDCIPSAVCRAMKVHRSSNRLGKAHPSPVRRSLMSAEPDLDVLYPNGYYFGEPSLHGKLLMEYSPSRGEVTFSRLMSGHVNILYSALIRTEAILRAGNFDPDFRISEDFD